MQHKNKVTKFIPLALSLVGIVLWTIARYARADFVDWVDFVMFVLALVLPAALLTLCFGNFSATLRSHAAIIAIIVAAAQVVIAIVYYYVFTVEGGGRALEMIPGSALVLSVVGLVRGYLINLMYAIAGAAFIASSAGCFFALHMPTVSTPEASNQEANPAEQE